MACGLCRICSHISLVALLPYTADILRYETDEVTDTLAIEWGHVSVNTPAYGPQALLCVLNEGKGKP